MSSLNYLFLFCCLAIRKQLDKNMLDIEILTNYMSLMDFETSKYGCKIGKGCFKTANPVLFRRIFCFLVSELGDFSEDVAKFSVQPMGKAEEALFRNSIKDIASSINVRYPNESKIIPINQSHLIAPQGTKIVQFLVSICETVILIKFKNANLLYVPPKNIEEYERIMATQSDCGDSSNLEKELEIMQEELRQLNEAENLALSKVSKIKNKVNENLLVSNAIKMRAESGINNDFIEKWKEEIVLSLQKAQQNMVTLSGTHRHVSNVSLNLKSLQESFMNTSPLNGLDILNNLGFKSNISAQMNGIELVEEGKLNLLSLFESACINATNFDDYIKNDGIKTLSKIQELLDTKNLALSESLELLTKVESNVMDLESKFRPLINIYYEKAFEKISGSQDLFYDKVKECNHKVNTFNDNYSVKKECPKIFFPVPDDELLRWIVGNKADHAISQISSTHKTFKKSRYLSLSSRKLAIEHQEKRKPAFSRVAMFLGLGSDRRATLASPSPRREHFRIRQKDLKAPLKPTSSKALFSSSSPFNQATAQKPLFDEVSEVEKEVSVEPSTSFASDKDDSLSLALGCGFLLNRSQSEPSLHLEQEMAKWDHLSDSDLDSPVLNNVSRSSKLNFNSSFGFSPENDDEIKNLISKYEALKKKINFSH